MKQTYKTVMMLDSQLNKTVNWRKAKKLIRKGLAKIISVKPTAKP
jgi:hypothetical protein